MPERSEETDISRLVVDRNLATLEEVRACLSKVRDREAAGQESTLEEVLLEEGLITPRQLRRLLGSSDDSGLHRPAQQIPGFQIIGKLGAGAMATVFKARQISLDRIVAIKVLPKRLSENREFVDRFHKEGKAAAKLNHNNIVQAIDVGDAGGYHYFVMEYVDGYTVYDELSKGKIYGEPEALQIIIQIARALEHAHQRGFIHRDVKPKNIMLTRDRVAKLADMGLARETSDVDAAMAEAGRAYGTPYYISPEQVRGEVDIDARADVYSLGVTFYHMVTGRVPFDAPTPAAVMHKHLKEPLIPPDHINTTLSSGVGEIVEVMMTKDRTERYANTTDLLEDLDAVARGEPPVHAHEKCDVGLLQGLSTGRPPEVNPRSQRPARRDYPDQGWPITLSIGLGVSVVLNVILVIMLLSKD